MSGNKLWIVGRAYHEDSFAWDFCGIFETEEEAIEACKTEFHFIGPVIVGAKLPEERIEWSGAYYPLRNIYSYTLEG